MSIQSTRTITREQAISRIREVVDLVENNDYCALERITFEPDETLRDFVDETPVANISHIDKWANDMLEYLMDKPFFRFSMFENYWVVEETDND